MKNENTRHTQVTLTCDDDDKYQCGVCAATVTRKRHVQNHQQTGYDSHKHTVQSDENCTANAKDVTYRTLALRYTAQAGYKWYGPAVTSLSLWPPVSGRERLGYIMQWLRGP